MEPIKDDVAIVGISCIFPQAPDIHTYWENIISKKNCISEMPELEMKKYFDPDSEEFERIYCNKGGYLGDLARFDPISFGVMPNSIEGVSPDHFLSLKVANESLKDSGIDENSLPYERTEVILGHGTYIDSSNTNWIQHGLIIDQTIEIIKKLSLDFSEKEINQIRTQLKRSLPVLNADNIPGIVPNIISGRIANKFNFMGDNYIIDAACASSLIAIENGVKDLKTGKCDLVIAGGVQTQMPPQVYMAFCALDVLSHKMEIRPFDKNADGTLPGEGIGIVVLMRKKDAEKKCKKIYGLIKSIGISSDGKSTGLLAPRLEGEVLAIKRAYEIADISPDTVELIEAHGTGIPLGDITEIKALTEVFGYKKGKYPTCAIGTVKSMIGHCIPAAGIAGIIKAVLSLYYKVLPPTLNYEEPNPEFELEKTPFYINTETKPWIHGNYKTPRRAGVNAFGFGGINAHCILEEYI